MRQSVPLLQYKMERHNRYKYLTGHCSDDATVTAGIAKPRNWFACHIHSFPYGEHSPCNE
ncbi:MAG: hypothetical protein LBO77_07365 [Desulfovibrio sp.]|jgi:hypothetical protein|nr:hypothetical protein [Desulfovibrio sp.]